jgi:hypothetical protein
VESSFNVRRQVFPVLAGVSIPPKNTRLLYHSQFPVIENTGINGPFGGVGLNSGGPISNFLQLTKNPRNMSMNKNLFILFFFE